VAGASYLDTSALVKLLLHERESEALVHYLETPRRVLSSALSHVETVRACRRAQLPADEALDLMQSVESISLGPAVVRAAGVLQPASLRSLDAIHLASAQQLNDPDLEFITYDARLAQAARAHGLRVVQPGR
jgi:uncharacterized protein